MATDPKPGTDGHGSKPGPLVWQALRPLCGLGLFLVGPLVSILLVSSIFDMPASLLWSAGAVGGFSVLLFAMLVRTEYRRLAAAMRRP